MKYLLTLTRFGCATLLVTTIGLSTFGCRDSASISEQTVEVPLSNLTVTPGTLLPVFSSNTTTYTVDAPTGAATVTVTATPQDTATTLTIDGAVTISGQARSVPLGAPGSSTTIRIVVSSSQNGLETTYTVIVTRLLSGDNNLSALSVRAGTVAQSLVPGFDTNHLDYSLEVGTNVGSVTITATKSDPNAAMLIGAVPIPAGTNPGQASITLGAPGTITPVTIEVTAPNGNKKTYNLSIKRPSGDNNLSALTVTPPGPLPPPGFNPSTLSYTVNVATNVNRVDVTATKSDINAVMAIGSVTVPAGTASGSVLNIPLGGPGNPTPISITVTAQNGNPKTYTVTVIRAASTDDTLSALTVTANSIEQTLNPGFSASTLDYTVNVATAVTEVIVLATKSDRNAVMLIGSLTVPAGTLSGQEPFPLGGPGTPTVISIVVTAQSGGAPRTYTIRVNRAASDDNNLSGLSLTAGTIPLNLTPAFDPNLVSYAVEVPFGIFEVTLIATKSDPNAVLSGSVPDPGIGVATGQATILFIFLPPPQVGITVTAPAGNFKTYFVTVNQAPSPFP
ncbi:MAG TPA: cadherin-like beta sandwich domain-containing protein [Nitrospira sp.]|nr:cadherin-like beta sandwich domain-containing protein [Nitrospira sp.]